MLLGEYEVHCIEKMFGKSSVPGRTIFSTFEIKDNPDVTRDIIGCNKQNANLRKSIVKIVIKKIDKTICRARWFVEIKEKPIKNKYMLQS